MIENIFRYFSESFGLFRFVSKQFCLFWLFRYRFETPKQTEIFFFWFHETNRNKRETDLVSVCFGSNRNFFFFISRTPYLHVYLQTFDIFFWWVELEGNLFCNVSHLMFLEMSKFEPWELSQKPCALLPTYPPVPLKRHLPHCKWRAGGSNTNV